MLGISGMSFALLDPAQARLSIYLLDQDTDHLIIALSILFPVSSSSNFSKHLLNYRTINEERKNVQVQGGKYHRSFGKRAWKGRLTIVENSKLVGSMSWNKLDFPRDLSSYQVLPVKYPCRRTWQIFTTYHTASNDSCSIFASPTGKKRSRLCSFRKAWQLQ